MKSRYKDDFMNKRVHFFIAVKHRNKKSTRLFIKSSKNGITDNLFNSIIDYVCRDNDISNFFKIIIELVDQYIDCMSNSMNFLIKIDPLVNKISRTTESQTSSLIL